MSEINRTAGFYNAELETMDSAARAEFLNGQLADIVDHAYANSPAMKDKFDAAGVKPGDVRKVKDLEKLPITEKTELVELQQKSPPFGGLVAVPLTELGRIFASPGPIYEPYELLYDDDRWGQSFFAAGFRKGDIGQITFSYHMVPFAMMLDDSLRNMGCLSVPTGVGNTEIQINIMKDVGVNAYLGTPSFLLALADRAEALGLELKKDINLDVGFVAAEMLPESLREQLETRFGMLIRQSYGTADIGCLGYECFHKNGMHWPDNVIVEIVDPNTGKQVGPWEIGEVVATCFSKTYPLIRFGTGDLSLYTDEPCACGRTTNRLVRIAGRVDQVTKVKGMFIYPNQADDLAAKFDEIDKHQVLVTRVDHKDIITYRVELKDGNIDQAGLKARIEEEMPKVLRLRGEVEFIPAGTLQGFYKKIDDQRVWD